MNGQLALDMTAGPLYRPTDPDTSRDAAVLALETAETLRDRCLQALRAAGEHGLTDFETAAIVGRQQTSTGKRRLELERAGLVAPRLVIDPKTLALIPDRRPTPSGATAIVWVAVEHQRTDAGGH